MSHFFLLMQLLWDAHLSEKGPEGWARYVSIIPTHWYVFSLGSAVDYTFSNPEKEIHNEGSAFGHVEKNWGQTFPSGHVWLQAFSSDNTSQVFILQYLRIFYRFHDLFQSTKTVNSLFWRALQSLIVRIGHAGLFLRSLLQDSK